jgi:hypothetical protein
MCVCLCQLYHKGFEVLNFGASLCDMYFVRSELHVILIHVKFIGIFMYLDIQLYVYNQNYVFTKCKTTYNLEKYVTKY